MKKVYFLLLIAITQLSHAEEWVQFGSDIECPDFILLNEGKYTVFNDCYGIDPKQPIIEKGTYSIEGKQITFVPKHRESTSFVASSSDKATYDIQKTKDQIILKSDKHVLHFKIR